MMQSSLQAAYLLFDHVSDGVCFADAGGDLLYMNPAAERLLELPRDEGKPRNACELLCNRLLVDGHKAGVNCPLRRETPDPAVTFVGRYGPHRAYGWRGDSIRRSERWDDLRVRCLRVEDVHMILIEDVAAERELQRHRDDWQKMIAHDLRSPLTSIFAGLRLLEELHPAAAESSEDAKLISASLQSCRRMMELLDLYLDVAKLDAGAMKAAPSDVRLAPLVDEAVAELEPLAAARRIRLEKAVPADVVVRADPSLLRRVLENLLDNAVKYNVDGGSVRVSAGVLQGKARLIVKDTGRGIDPADLPFVFDRYFQAEARRAGRTKGTGLGLAFCKQALATMGGAIEVDSGRDEGSEFTVVIPLAGGQS